MARRHPEEATRSFLTLALDGGESSASRDCVTSGERGSSVPTEQDAGPAPEPVWRL